MNCQEFQDQLARYEEGEMSPQEQAEFEAVVKQCAHLAGYQASFRTAVQLVRKHCACASPETPIFAEHRVALIMSSVRVMLGHV